MKWTIKNRMIAGFSFVALVLFIYVTINYRGLQDNDELITRVTELRNPTANSSAKMLNGINQSLAGLRGWMLLGNENFKTVRARAWSDYIDKGYADMEVLSKSWTNPENVAKLKEVKTILDEFKLAQEEIENMANSEDNIPSYKMLLDQAAPQAAIMSAKITEIIDIELTREATTERKAVLGMMADVRGTLGLGLANIRAYLLTGDTKFSDGFNTLWEKNDRRFSDLSGKFNSLNSSQQNAFNDFRTARNKFTAFPEKMFELRGAEEWNLANYWLKTKAAPRAARLTLLLEGMAANQQTLLANDITALKDLSSSMKSITIISTVIGILLIIVTIIYIVNSITGPINRLNKNISDVASGNLTTNVVVTGDDEISVATRNIKKMVTNLKEVIVSINTAAENITIAGSEMNDSSQQMSDGASQQASSAEEVSSSVEEMAANIQQNTDNAKETEKIAISASDSINESSVSVNRTVDSMKTITSKISIIGEIARQTNLLALNAAVEAARAGEHGKGFAVVAAEIRRLAERSQTAASEIDEVSSVSVDIAEGSGKLLQEIVPEIQKTADLVREITSASIEQNNGADQINSAIQLLNQVAQQNAAGAEEMAASSEELSAQAHVLKDTISFFDIGKTKDVSFKAHKNKEPKKKVAAKDKDGSIVNIDLKSGNDALDSEYEKF
ncbi:MAG: methyl-accepting chemotaxis protein [Cyclobacteriaceae bacterium]|nr:methyl-accepting chemotaxis protein [Cyclobacteriaceae bacterium]